MKLVRRTLRFGGLPELYTFLMSSMRRIAYPRHHDDDCYHNADNDRDSHGRRIARPWSLVLIPFPQSESLTMEYKRFIVRAFEREPGKWRASVERADGKAIMTMTNRRTLNKFVTGVDVKSAQVATLMAMAAIDAGAFLKASSKARR